MYMNMYVNVGTYMYIVDVVYCSRIIGRGQGCVLLCDGCSQGLYHYMHCYAFFLLVFLCSDYDYDVFGLYKPPVETGTCVHD